MDNGSFVKNQMNAHGLSRRSFLTVVLTLPLLGILHVTQRVESSGRHVSDTDDEFLMLGGWVLLKSDLVDWIGDDHANRPE